jgi:tripartite-type tricarboxylate transporter receptor subunit TctC
MPTVWEDIMARLLTSTLLTGLLSLGAAAPASAQAYPDRPIRVIGSSSPGGISDVFIRTLGEELHKRLGQPLIVENRPGGAFNIATRACAEAPTDGYTICILPNEPVTYNPFLFKSLPFDPDKGLAPITQLFFMTQVLAVSTSLNVKSLPALAALSKARPSTLSYSSPGYAQALFVEKFKEETGADMVRVPFKGGGDAVTGLLSGTTPVVFIGVANVLAHIRAGTITALVVDDDTRSPLVPDVQTIAETGYKGDMTRSYFGLFAPAGTPRPVIDKLRQEIAAIVSEPAFRDKNLIQRGLVPAINTPEEFAAYIRKDRAAAERVVKASGLQAQ